MLLLLTIPLSLAVINIIPWLAFQVSSSNTKRTNFDAIFVLGNPANSDGTPSEVMR